MYICQWKLYVYKVKYYQRHYLKCYLDKFNQYFKEFLFHVFLMLELKQIKVVKHLLTVILGYNFYLVELV